MLQHGRYSKNTGVPWRLLLNIVLETVAREIRQENEIKASDWKKISKTLSLCRWYDFMFRTRCCSLRCRPRWFKRSPSCSAWGPCPGPWHTGAPVHMEAAVTSGDRTSHGAKEGLVKSPLMLTVYLPALSKSRSGPLSIPWCSCNITNFN